MSTIAIYVKRPDGAVSYVGEAKEVTLTSEPEDSRPHFRSSVNRTLTLEGDDLGPLSRRKLRRVEIRRIDDVFETGLAFDVVPAVVHEDGRFVVLSEQHLRVYANMAQYQGLYPRDEIQFIDV